MKAVPLSAIAALAGYETGSDRTITKALAIDDAAFDSESIGWCNEKNLSKLDGLNAGNVIVPAAACGGPGLRVSENVVLIPAEHPRRTFLKVLQEFFVDQPEYGVIADSASIHASVKLDRGQVAIAENVVVGANCVVGKGVQIGPNTVIMAGTVIEDKVIIGANNTIGGVGFGYEPDEEGQYELMPHIGNVHLSEGVEIGNNTCIDRAVMGSTFLGKNVKVDNLVHIAHGVEIGENSLIIANAMIAGSVKIGANTWVSPSSSIRQKLEIGDGSLVGMGAVVVKNVASGEVVAGNPAKPFPQS